MEDFIRILTEPKNALIKQYMALLETEGVKLEFTDDALRRDRRDSPSSVNEGTENIGARRLHTIMERCSKRSASKPPTKKKQIKVDAEYVRKQLAEIVKDQDLSTLHPVVEPWLCWFLLHTLPGTAL